MNDKKAISLTEMRAGRSGIILHLHGGSAFVSRLQALGLRPGKRVTKVSSMVMHGPTTVQVDGTQIALGFGMASHIIVQTD